MKLLASTPPAELPEEALLARLRCRRAAINVAAVQVETPAADLVGWVYRRLNRRLRNQLEPFLDQLAMRHLVLSLRYGLVGEPAPAAVGSSPLVASSLQRLVTAAGDGKAKIAQLEVALSGDYAFAAGLEATYQSQGPGGVEQQLADGILQHGLARSRPALLKETLRYLVDMRNVLMVQKLWHWQVARPPQLTDGGSIATSNLQRVWRARDSERLVRLVSRRAREPVVSTKTVAMEQCLLNGLTRLLRHGGRDPLGLGVVIDYLWRVQIAVHNQVLRQTLAADRETLLEEVLLL